MPSLKKRLITVSTIALLCACGGSSFLHTDKWYGKTQVAPEADAEISTLFPQLHHSSTSGQYLSAVIARQNGDASQALSYLNEAIGLGEADNDLYLDAYGLALSAGDIDLAAHFAAKVEDHGESVILSPKLLQAVIAIKQQKFDEAEIRLKQAPQKGFGKLVIGLLDAWVKQAQGKHADLSELELMATQGGEFQVLIQYQLALLEDAMGVTHHQEPGYFDKLAEYPSLPYPMALTLAQYHKRHGNESALQKLASHYDEKTGLKLSHIKESQPLTATEGASEVFFGITTLLTTVNALEAAKVPLHLTEYLRPGHISTRFMRAQIAETMQDYELAVQEYTELKADKVYGLLAAIQLVYLHQDREDNTEALKQADSLLQSYPEHQGIWLAKGDILRSDKRYDAAAKAYTQAIELVKEKKAEHWPSFYSRAIAYERAGEWRKAEADFLEALRLQPDQPDVLNYLGYSWLIQNRHLSQAKAMIEKAMRARPRDAHIIDSMGWAYYRLGEYEKAASYLERAVDLSPRDATVNEHLGDVYWRMGHETQARYQWQRALAFDPTEPGQAEGLEGKIASGLPAADVPKSDVMQAGFTAESKDEQRAEIQSETEKSVE